MVWRKNNQNNKHFQEKKLTIPELDYAIFSLD